MADFADLLDDAKTVAMLRDIPFSADPLFLRPLVVSLKTEGRAEEADLFGRLLAAVEDRETEGARR